MLAKIFSRRQREEILAHMLGNPSKGYRVREISKEFKVSVGSVSQCSVSANPRTKILTLILITSLFI